MWGYWSFSKIQFFKNIEKKPLPTDFFSLTFSRRHFEWNFSERNHPKNGTCSGTFHPNGWNMESLNVCSKWLQNSYKYFCAILQETDAEDEEKQWKRELGKSARHREGARGSKRSRRSVFPLWELQSFLRKENELKIDLQLLQPAQIHHHGVRQQAGISSGVLTSRTQSWHTFGKHGSMLCFRELNIIPAIAMGLFLQMNVMQKKFRRNEERDSP